MGQMNFKRGKSFWICIGVIFLLALALSENAIFAVGITVITVLSLYVLYIILARFFN
jgi:hypothetical protein